MEELSISKRLVQNRRNSLRTIGSKLYLTWLVSYIVIFIVPLLVGVIVYSKAETIILNETLNTNREVIRQVKVSSDFKLKEFDYLSLQIALNQKVVKFLNYDENLDEDQRYTIIQILADFNVYINSNSFVDTFFVYFKNSNCVLSPTAKYDADDILNKIQVSNEGISCSINDCLSEQKFSRKLLSGTISTGSDPAREVILYVQSLPFMTSVNQGAIIIVINKTSFYDIYEEVIQDNKKILLIDQQDNVLLTNLKMNFAAFNELDTANSNVPVEISDTNEYLFRMDSDIMPLKYAMIVQIDQFTAQAKLMKNIALISSLIGFFFVLGLSFLFAKYNYNPISEMVHIVKTRITVPCEVGSCENEDNKINELALIKNAILMTLEDSEKVKLHLEYLKPIIKKNYLQRLITGNIYGESLPQDLEYCGINFNTDSFAVFIAHHEARKQDLPEQERVETSILVTEIFRRALEKTGMIYDIDEDDELIYIINLYQPVIANYNLKGILSFAKQSVKRRLSVDLSIACSETTEGIPNIHNAFMQARKVMEYRLLLGKNNVLSIDDIKNITCDSPFTFSDKSRLIHAIAAGDRQAMRDLFDEIFVSNLSGKYISIELGRCLFYDMINTAIGIAKMHESNAQGSFAIDTASIDEMLNCGTIQELKDKIIKIYEDICDHVAQNKKSRTMVMTEMVTKFIDDHFSDPNLSVSSIAKYFYINSAYLGNLYKEHTGQNIIDAIGVRRTFEAKQMLQDSNEKVKVISEKVGFTNVNTFLRSFKRYEGITPQQYRMSISHSPDTAEGSEISQTDNMPE